MLRPPTRRSLLIRVIPPAIARASLARDPLDHGPPANTGFPSISVFPRVNARRHGWSTTPDGQPSWPKKVWHLGRAPNLSEANGLE